MDTKQKILDESLSLFSKKGYDAVSVGEIAQAVGIKAPSLYKHFKSKKSIFNAILDEMAKRYTQQMIPLQMDGFVANADADMFATLSEEQLIQIGKDLFQYFLHDEYVCKFRKMLTIEQYHNGDLANIYTKQYVDDPLDYQSLMFGTLKNLGLFKGENANITALQFYSPIYFLITLCDRHPQREQEALTILEQHIKQFNSLYRIDEVSK